MVDRIGPVRVIVNGVCFATASLLAGHALADDLPIRKAGAWAVTIDANGVSMTAEHCSDAATDKKMQAVGQGMLGGSCSKNEVKRTSGGYLVDSECTFGGSTMISRADFKGDFSGSYEGTITATFEPPFLGQTASTTKMRAKYMGPCPSGRKPGDITTEGVTMNINEMGRGFPGIAE